MPAAGPFIKPPRRKRKVTAPASASTLTTVSIKEEETPAAEITTREGGETKGEVGGGEEGGLGHLFTFLTTWERVAAEQRVGHEAALHTALQQSDEVVWSGGTRGPCLEDELAARLARMTWLGRVLKKVCVRERSLSRALYKEAIACRQRAGVEFGALQARVSALNSEIRDVMQQHGTLQKEYTKLLEDAARREAVLEEKVKQLNAEMETLQGRVTELTVQRDVVINERDALIMERDAVIKERDAVIKERDAVIAERDIVAVERDAMLANQNTNTDIETWRSRAELARGEAAHLMMLLDIALSRLRLYEDGTDLRQTPRQTVKHKPQHPDTPRDTKKPMPDTLSMTSFETTFSELSLPIMSDQPTSRNNSISEDRLSTTSLREPSPAGSSLGAPSPATSVRKKSKKRSFFGRSFSLKKSISVDSQLSAPLSDRLPTITDERAPDKLSSTETNSQHSLTDYYSPREEVSIPLPENYASGAARHRVSKHENSDNCSMDETVVYGGAAENTQLHYNKITDIEGTKDDDKPEEKGARRIQRTASFGTLGKGGLVALAKDIEKRFRKKRRSKTADFSELNQFQHKDFNPPLKRTLDDSVF